MAGQRIPFQREDEERIASAALWGMIASIASIAAGLLDAGIKLVSSGGMRMVGVLVGSSVSLSITIVLGVFLFQASVAFRKVAVTDEADEHYLLEGFSKLRLYFKVMGILMIVALGLIGIVLLGSLMCRMAL